MSFTEKLAQIVEAGLRDVEEARNSYTRSLQNWTPFVEERLRAARDVLREKVPGADSSVPVGSNRSCTLTVHVDPTLLSELGDDEEQERKYTLTLDASDMKRAIVVRAECDQSRSPLFVEDIDPRELGPETVEKCIAQFVEAIMADLGNMYRPVS